MIVINCKQGSEEWLWTRAGVITASRAKDAIDVTAKGGPKAKSISYAAEVAMGRVTGEPADEGFVSWQMKRGTELEPHARIAYEAKTGNLASESGIVLTDDRVFGYSTDGFVEDDGLIEIKCQSSPEKIIELWRTRDVSEYMHQMQMGMWITNRKWCDLVMYAPQLVSVGKELFIECAERDEEFIDAMVERLLAFAKRVDDNEAVLRG